MNSIYVQASKHMGREELLRLIADMAEEIRLLQAGWYAAKAFIEASVSENPPEDADGLYDAYIEAGRKL